MRWMAKLEVSHMNIEYNIQRYVETVEACWLNILSDITAQFVCDLVSAAVTSWDKDTVSATTAFKKHFILLTDKTLVNTVLFTCYDNTNEKVEYEYRSWLHNILTNKNMHYDVLEEEINVYIDVGMDDSQWNCLSVLIEGNKYITYGAIFELSIGWTPRIQITKEIFVNLSRV